MGNKYPKGAEWQKWDLHLHTPSSYDYKDKSITDNNKVATNRTKFIKQLSIKSLPGYTVTNGKWFDNINNLDLGMHIGIRWAKKENCRVRNKDLIDCKLAVHIIFEITNKA